MILGLRSDQIAPHLFAPMRQISDELEAEGYHIKIMAGRVTPVETWASYGVEYDPDKLIFAVFWHHSIYHPEHLPADWVEFITSGLHPTEAKEITDHLGRTVTVFIVNQEKDNGTTELSVEE